MGFKTAVDPSLHTIWMNREKNVPIRKVRIYTPSVTNPLPIKEQRDKSAFEHKRNYYVVNSGNYCMAIYEGTDKKGRTKRSFEIVNSLDAARYFKSSTDKSERTDLVPLSDTNSYPLKWILKPGTMVLFYENSPEELYDCGTKELAKRLYKVTGLEKDGRIQCVFHQEARDSESVNKEMSNTFEISEPSPKLRISLSKLNAYVEGYDFELTVTGEIKFKH